MRYIWDIYSNHSRILLYISIIIFSSETAILVDNSGPAYIKQCQPIFGYKPNKYLIVTQCPPMHMDTDIIHKCYDPTLTTIGKIPVTNINRGITFQNIYCAMCYNQYNEITRWQLSMRCDVGVMIKDYADLDSLTGCQTTVNKPDHVSLTPCGKELPSRKRRAMKTLTPTDPHQPVLGYSTLLNFGVDGKMHIVLTSEMDEFMSKTQCTEEQIFNPFDQECIRIDCPTSHISYNGECMEPVSYMKETKQLCIDYLVHYAFNTSFKAGLSSRIVKNAIAEFLDRDFNIPPKRVLFPSKILSNKSLCAAGSAYSTQLLWTTTDPAFNDSLLNITVSLFDAERTPKDPTDQAWNTGNVLSGNTHMSLRFPYGNTNKDDMERLMDTKQTEKQALVISHNNLTEPVGMAWIVSMNTSIEHTNWCRGMKNEYINDEFTVIKQDNQLLGVRIRETNKTYHLSQFQYTTVIGGTFWGNITQIAWTCDTFPQIMNESCTKIAIKPENYKVFANGSLYVIPFKQFSEAELPFDTDPRPEIQSIFTTSEYEYMTNHTESVLLEYSELSKFENLTATVCLQRELLALLIELDVWSKVHINKSCEYLQRFGYGTTIVGLVCSGLSLVAMVLVLMTYSIFKTMRTMPGVSLMHLTVAITLSQITFIVGLFTPGDTAGTDYGCFSMAVITHYCILASLMWMNVMAYSSYKAFGANLKTRLLQLSRRHLILNSLYGWGLPAAIVLVCAIVDHVHKDRQLIAYGIVSAIQVFEERNSTGKLENIQVRYRTMASCWIGNSKAALVIFGLPLVYSMIINLALFIKTCWGMRAARKDGRPKTVLRRDSGSGHLKQRNDMTIHIRLSAQYGFAWIFAIIIIMVGTSKTESETICYILYILNLVFNILHGCTGLFIFIAFICNKRILHLYKSKILKKGLNKRSKSSNSVFHISSKRIHSSLSTSYAWGNVYTPPDSPLDGNNNTPSTQ